jgi:hypothetical protein
MFVFSSAILEEISRATNVDNGKIYTITWVYATRTR